MVDVVENPVVTHWCDLLQCAVDVESCVPRILSVVFPVALLITYITSDVRF